jgi:hypothetical protein
VSVSNSASAAIGEPRPIRLATGHGMLGALGLSRCVASFLLLTIGDFGRLAGPLREYFCAESALIYPFSEDGRSFFHEKPIECLAFPGSGLINPVFLTTFFLYLFRLRRRVRVVLRNLTILLIRLRRIGIRYGHFYSREGYVLWVPGMLLTLFAMSDAKFRHPAERTA